MLIPLRMSFLLIMLLVKNGGIEPLSISDELAGHCAHCAGVGGAALPRLLHIQTTGSGQGGGLEAEQNF